MQLEHRDSSSASLFDSHNRGSSVFFRRLVANFGSVAVGSLARQKIELCNATDSKVTVFISDCSLPFVVLHNEVHLKPKSYVRLPVRFVPVSGPKEFTALLVAQTEDGRYHTSITLTGNSYFLDC
jgi:hypothetical protein